MEKNDFLTRILPVSSKSINFYKKESKKHHFDASSLTISSPDTLKALQEAVQVLKEGIFPIAFPTETVYGLGADATNSKAVMSIFQAKNRPSDNPLIVHISSLDQLQRMFHSNVEKIETEDIIPPIYMPLIDRFWPGPLTIILPIKNFKISPIVAAKKDTIAIRMPSNHIALAIIALFDMPIAAPSANISTRPSSTLASHVYHDFKGKIPIIIDDGPCHIGLESTVVDGLVDPPVILRPGSITKEQIKSCGGKWKNVLVYTHKDTNEVSETIPRAPGMKYKHYSPKAKVVLFEPTSEESVIKWVTQNIDVNIEKKTLIGIMRTMHWKWEHLKEIYLKWKTLDCELGCTGSEITKNIFSSLRNMDLQNVNIILIEGVSEKDEGLAIMNRIRCSASIIVLN
ncbi:Sua5/YciO/YrdC/YwlC family tRNA threonylcarbamoyl adenosine modification protein [Pneumocystis jirovecii RU7]|uniref:Threonylcarbamoyl-AMP synthase n=1 Tax=Pneumocystis jirovecii (strain RU7) TaxID=1408657 RepID=A0A0W4ZRZ8_PNEJ7|nr:Sua5/YciO/YrdC/YwlC family tRNA threonylcarbamoyl adenosine modification protein [Pneumocystis jirovecii RU7]KTW31153.1 Sua5/YciO/YrdC/YwlC family tRNA threonylcarbamoyl adenosine modification protein [Pneumocystis jirovecii RU7]